MIQVAAPEAGLFVDCRHDKTDWQLYSSEFKAYGRERLVYPITTNENGQTDPRRMHLAHTPLRTRHLSPTVRGKQQIKFVKRHRQFASRLAKRINTWN
jgi:hypothetical protein